MLLGKFKTAGYVDIFTHELCLFILTKSGLVVVLNLEVIRESTPRISKLNKRSMQANQQLNFLKEKIQEIGSAIFFNQSDSVLKLPTSIVETVKVDDFGLVWFYVQKPRQDLREFDKEFPVRLDFFRKGKSYFLQIEGKAWMVNDPEEINTLQEVLSAEEKAKMKDMILVKVKILKAEYHETAVNKPAKSSWWQSAVRNVYAWFRSGHGVYRPEVFHPASLN